MSPAYAATANSGSGARPPPGPGRGRRGAAAHHGRRAPWRAEDAGEEWTRFPIARLHYTKSSKLWTLYYRDRNLKFHLDDPAPPAESIATLLSEIDKDPTGIFWG